jgi:hypothetical protein
MGQRYQEPEKESESWSILYPVDTDPAQMDVKDQSVERVSQGWLHRGRAG